MATRRTEVVSGEVVGPLREEAARQEVSFAATAAGLSKWERHKLEWQARRQRLDAMNRALDIEAATAVNEAIVHAGGRVRAAEERAELSVHAERTDCILEAGHIHEEAQAATRQLSEDSRELIQLGIDRVTVNYLRGVERRASGVSRCRG